MKNEELKFPLKWNYRIITLKECSNAKTTIEKILREHGIADDPQVGAESKKGKYLTYKVSVVFDNREAMTQLSEALANADCVKFLL